MPPAAFIAAATPTYAAPGSTTIITILTPPTTQAGDALLWFVWSGAAAGEVDT